MGIDSAPGAVAALRTGPAAGAFRLGQDAIDLLDRHGHPVPLTLLRRLLMLLLPAVTASRARRC